MDTVKYLLDRLNFCETYNYHSFEKLHKDLFAELANLKKQDKSAFEYLLKSLSEYISINQTDLDITQEHRVFIKKLKNLVDFWRN